ncbi:hypothetical protein SADUNF_Sadunf14G0050300 [Salix dunnii]|uniref:Uncharacterized protein n=1 Tax=Salix dunnii TaxID=1413687 RepID=A0A835JI33_9ROSI|nr:hypothetical protein SADUNF_Sadunf14G0050300 [Salix dunnii]
MHDPLLLQEIKGENGFKKEEMGMSPSHEDVQAAQLDAQLENDEESKGYCSLCWRRWRELCTATPALAKTCLFRLTAKKKARNLALVYTGKLSGSIRAGTGYSNHTMPKPVNSGGWTSPVRHLPAKNERKLVACRI